MNFKGHMVGGLVSAATVTSISMLTLGESSIGITEPVVIFSACLFMSLFPDLDTASIPQRWFYRSLIFIIPYVYLYYNTDYLFIISFLSITPLIHKHRGWTHWKITPFLISFFVLAFYDKNKGVYKIKEIDLLFDYSLFTLSVVVGHYTHLILDSKTIKIFKNAGDHH